MTAVILVAPNSAEVTVGSLAEFVELVFGQGYYPKTGSIDSNKAALHGGAAPSPDPASLVRLGDLQTPTSDAAAALHGELLPKWKPTRAVVAGELYLAPDGQPIQRIADGTTRASYDATEQAAWSLPLRAAYVPKWKPSTAYASGEFVLNPSGQVVSANSAFTSGTTYSASNWTVVPGGGGGAVSSVAGRTGAVTLTSTDLTDSTATGQALVAAASAAAARTALGLGTAATQPSSAFDASGAATTAQGLSLQKASNLSDLASATTARTNLGLGTAATQDYSRAVRLPASALPGPPVTTINACAYTTGTNSSATGQTARNTYLAPAACTDLRLVWFGWYVTSSGEQALAQQVTFKAAIEYNGVILPVTMGGTRSLTIDPWGACISDPLGIDLPAGATFSVRVFMNTPSTSQPFPQTIGSGGGVAITPTGDGYATGDIVDSGAMTNTNASRFNLWMPAAVCGRFIGSGVPVVALVGDSITRGSAGSYGELGSGYSWGWRGLNGQLPSINLGIPSETVQTAASATGYARRATLLAHSRYAIVLYGTNDFPAGRSAAQIQADLTTVYTRLANRGITVYGATMPPKTTSTDSWATTTNQTVTANEAVRVAVNNWIRTNPAPLTGYLETADAVETARNSGLWKVDGTANKYTVDGTHPSQTGHAAMGAVINPAVFV